MAESSKKQQSNTTRKRAAAKGSSSKAQAAGNGNGKVRFEIILLAILACCIFMIVSNFGGGGFMGKTFAGFFFGLFGFIQYVLPFAVFAAVVFLYLKGFAGEDIRRVIYSVVILLMIGMFMQMVQGIPESGKVSEFYAEGWQAFHTGEKPLGVFGGGFICGGLALLFSKLIGKIGAFILIFVVIIAMVLLLSKQSLIQVLEEGGIRLKGGFDEAREQSKEHREQRRESMESLEEARQRKREEREEAKRARAEKAKSELDLRREEAERKKAKSRLMKDAKTMQQMDESDYDRFNRKVDRKMFRNLRVLSGQDTVEPKPETTYYNPEEVHEIRMVTEDEDGNEMMRERPQHHNPQSRGINGLDQPRTVSVFTEAEMSYEEPENPEPVMAEPIKVGSIKAEPVITEPTQATSRPPRKRADRGLRLQEVSDPQGVTEQRKTSAVTKTGKSDSASKKKPVTRKSTAAQRDGYHFPTYDLLRAGEENTGNPDQDAKEMIAILHSTLENFGVHATVTNYSCGPAVTQFELQPELGVKVSKIVGLSDEFMLALAAKDIRIEAPIPGKSAIGIEVPNKNRAMVHFRDLIESDKFVKFPSNITFAVGKDISGQVVVSDIAKMPHLLIAGSTGSGKSVCINTIIMSILYKAHPDDVKLIMIDPKMVELTAYNGIPHLLIPVVTDAKKAAGALNWAVQEMTKRYQTFAECSVRNIDGYNKKYEELNAQYGDEEAHYKKMPQIVVIVDELADLMSVARADVEDAIERLTALARAAGIHLVIATQRPSVDVITGTIKNNVPSRIAFAVSSLVDSRTILDMSGAEKLLGKGDMLFAPTGYPKPVRVQGAFVDDDDVARVVEYIIEQNSEADYDSEVASQIDQATVSGGSVNLSGAGGGESAYDEYLVDAAKAIVDADKASIGMLQRKFRVGFNRAARMMDQLASIGIVGPEEGTKPREILVSAEQLENMIEEGLL